MFDTVLCFVKGVSSFLQKAVRLGMSAFYCSFISYVCLS